MTTTRDNDLVLRFDDVRGKDIGQVGGKNASLAEMTQTLVPRGVSVFVVAVVAVVGLMACEAPPPPLPPSSATSVTSTTMQALASDIGGLQDTLTVSALDAAAVERAIAGLNALSSRARALHGKGVAAHPLVREGMPSFVVDVEAARAALQRQPPDPEPARMLAQSCRACHALALAPSSSSTSTSVMATRLAVR